MFLDMSRSSPLFIGLLSSILLLLLLNAPIGGCAAQSEGCINQEERILFADELPQDDDGGYRVWMSGRTVLVYSDSTREALVYQESSPGSLDFVEVLPRLDLCCSMRSMAFEGLTIGIGDTATGTGSVSIYQASSVGATDFSLVAVLTPSDNHAVGPYTFGYDVAIDGVTVVVAVLPDYTNPDELGGAIYVFQESAVGAGDFTQVSELTSSDNVTSIYFCNVVAIHGVTIVGSTQNWKIDPSFVTVFQSSSVGANDWVAITNLTSIDGVLQNYFGYALDIHERTIIVGAPEDDQYAPRSGAVYVYQESAVGAGDFIGIIKFSADDAAERQRFGFSVQISELNQLVVGAKGDDRSDNDGCAYVFHSVGEPDFAQVRKIRAKSWQDWSEFGETVAISSEGDVIVVGTGHGEDYALSVRNGAFLYATDCIDHCLSSPCGNGATCTDDLNLFNCACAYPWVGLTCNDYACPCLNNGSCAFLDAGCNCNNTGFQGDYCETEVDECASFPCLNGGSCSDIAKDFVCNCTAIGFQGKFCESDMDDCLSSPCMNGGICEDAGVNSFTCNCDSTGYKGTTCTKDVNSCKSDPCENGGVCTDLPGLAGFSCNCSVKFEGIVCEVEIDYCASSPCMNGATCDGRDIPVMCACADGYEGSYCELIMSDCMSSPCQNDGNCTSTGISSFTCECSTKYTGAACETLVEDPSSGQDSGWTSSGQYLGPSEFPPVTFILTIPAFVVPINDTLISNSTSGGAIEVLLREQQQQLAESFAIELKQTILPAVVGGGPSDYEVTVLEQGDGSYEFTVQIANRNGYDYPEIERRILDDDVIANRVNGTIRVQQVVEESSAYHLHGSIAMTVIVMWSMTLLM